MNGLWRFILRPKPRSTLSQVISARGQTTSCWYGSASPDSGGARRCQMIKEPAETQERMLARYAGDL